MCILQNRTPPMPWPWAERSFSLRRFLSRTNALAQGVTTLRHWISPSFRKQSPALPVRACSSKAVNKDTRISHSASCSDPWLSRPVLGVKIEHQGCCRFGVGGSVLPILQCFLNRAYQKRMAANDFYVLDLPVQRNQHLHFDDSAHVEFPRHLGIGRRRAFQRLTVFLGA